MNSLLKINKAINKVRLNSYWFSKEHKNKKGLKNQTKAYVPQIKKPQPQPVIQEHPIEKNKIDKNEYLKHMIMINAMAAGLIPLYNPVNAGIMLLNGGYLFSQLSDQIKKFLLLVNNKQYENLKVYDRPKVYVKLVASNAFLLSLCSIFVSFDYYIVANLVTLGWYGFNIINNKLPESYWFMAFPLIFMMVMNFFSENIRAIILDKKIQNIERVKEQK